MCACCNSPLPCPPATADYTNLPLHVQAKAPRKKGGKSSGVETKPEEENEERTERGVVGPGDGVSPNAAASSAVSNPPPATGRPSGADGSRKRAMCPGANPGVRGRKPKLSPRRVKGEGVGKGKEELAGGEGRAEAGNDGEKVVAASAAQQRCHKQLEEKREEQREQQQKEQQQQMHEEQRLLQQQQQHRQQQESVQMPLHHPMFLQHNPQHQHQAFMQQQIHQHQQQPAIGNPALGFDSDGGPVPRVQSLNTLPANPPISGSLSVQVLCRLLKIHNRDTCRRVAVSSTCGSLFFRVFLFFTFMVKKNAPQLFGWRMGRAFSASFVVKVCW